MFANLIDSKPYTFCLCPISKSAVLLISVFATLNPTHMRHYLMLLLMISLSIALSVWTSVTDDGELH